MVIKQKKLLPHLKLDFMQGAGIAIVLLLVVNLYFAGKINTVVRNNERNSVQLNAVVAGFSAATFDKVSKDVAYIKANIVSLSQLFDPRDRAGSATYDLNVHFVEALDNASKEINVKAEAKGSVPVDLGFREKLASQKDQAYIMNQLLSLKNVVLKGMDVGIVFNDIAPQNIEKTDVAGMRIAKSRIELSCPVQKLMDFILQLDSLTPALCIDTCTIAMRGSMADITLLVSNVIVDLPWMQKKEDYEHADIKAIEPVSTAELSKAIRGKNIFSLSDSEDDAQKSASALSANKKAGDIPRFYYRGKAMLRGKTVVVVEDTQKKETAFVAEGGMIADYKLMRFNSDAMVLQNVKDGKELSVAKSTPR
jgi:hypothetical protein